MARLRSRDWGPGRPRQRRVDGDHGHDAGRADLRAHRRVGGDGPRRRPLGTYYLVPGTPGSASSPWRLDGWDVQQTDIYPD